MATITTADWSRKSGVHTCRECHGHGLVHAHRRATINDPYPENTCEDCGGEGGHACPVCGFDVECMGYDCFVCESLSSLNERDLAKITPAHLLASFAHAMEAAKAAQEER